MSVNPAFPDIFRIACALSPERLGPYLAIRGSELDAALELYEWNGEISAAWWSVVADLEVLLRNAMHEQLTVWSRAHFNEPLWYMDPGGMLSPKARQTIAMARAQVVRNYGQETPCQVITELTFGFWRFLLTARYERTLWRVCLYKAWPGEGLRKNVHDAVLGLHGLRNRIAHHEPIHNRPLGELHGKALAAAGWICPDTAAWIGLRSRVPGLLECRPVS